MNFNKLFLIFMRGIIGLCAGNIFYHFRQEKPIKALTFPQVSRADVTARIQVSTDILSRITKIILRPLPEDEKKYQYGVVCSPLEAAELLLSSKDETTQLMNLIDNTNEVLIMEESKRMSTVGVHVMSVTYRVEALPEIAKTLS